MIRLVLSVVAGLVTGLPTVTPADIHFRHDVLRPGTAGQAGLLADQVAALPGIAASYLEPTLDHPGHPAYAGATVLAAHHGIVVSRFAVGDAVRYGAGPTGIVELPAERRIPARTDTLWDLASISKLFTTIVVLQQVQAGRVDLDAPVARYVPEFAAGGKAAITTRHLLTHTSGLPAFRPFYASYPTPETRLAAALSTPVTAGTTPGEQYVYSDIGLISLGVLIERVTGESLADAVHDGVTGPLRMRDTGYRPAPELLDRIAATEYEPYVNRGMVRGEVHDENAWSLGGVAGHAGVFSTVDDLAILCQTLLDGGTYRGHRILSTPMVRQALVDYNAELLPRYPDSARGLGFELAKHWYMDGMTSPVSFGHTGFTGTSLVIDPLDQSFLILLSNRVHPDRAWGSNNVARRALARAFAAAHPIAAPPGDRPWRTETRDGADLTLTAPLRRAAGEQARGSFLFWYDTEPAHDTVRLESSADGVSWAPVPMTLPGIEPLAQISGFGGRHWWPATISVPAGVTRLRFTYHTDASSQGRGVLVDRLRVVEPGAILVDGRTTLAADGWHLTAGS
ncbi:serine hydrolase domain-containing protein [Actinoplanes oblitus]|uniref:Serine hydrolase domain-containing protein n=1 Tax=Actinoplanes oblitus TaxID=3040509 RepID=A0ABY8WS18_9ACTN|nr:serine hydrolase domain-containing protein [Actinoplanes oblitus]WIM99597.1 serine hydrolase domain-containing protein [Actinoplanes oblitus]